MTPRTIAAAAVGAMAGILAFALFIAANAARLGDPSAPPAAAPVATTSVAPATDAGYAVWGRDDDGTPVRWDPCSPIPWVIDDADAPPEARELVSQAFARIAGATGLSFEFRGRTSEVPSRDRPLVDDSGDSWAPVLVAWVPGGSTDLPLGDGERGVTVPVAVRDGGPQVFVTGQVLFNSDKTLLPGFDDRHGSWGAVVLHELGHLVGLDHVDDPEQLMHPTPGIGPVAFGDGDLAGLRAVGAEQGCLTRPQPQDLEVRFDR